MDISVMKFPKYKSFFNSCINYGTSLRLKSDFYGVVKMKIVNYPIINLNYNMYSIQNVISNFVGRTVKRTEYFYIIEIENSVDVVYIPQKELSELLRNKEILKLFKNIKSITFNPLNITVWNHGTLNKRIKSIKDLNPNTGNNFGDFGKGVYLTNVFQVAKNYSFGQKGRKLIEGQVLRGTWCNNSLSEVFNGLLKNLDNNGTQCYDTFITDNKNRKFRVKVFTKNSSQWRSALWDGWIESKRQNNCDLVIGPMSAGRMPVLQSDILYRLQHCEGDYNKLLKCKNDFERNLNVLSFENENGIVEVYQLCIYYNEVLNGFVDIK